jgi:hypothetical protein
VTEIIGLDPSQALIDLARPRVRAAGKAVSFLPASAEAIPRASVASAAHGPLRPPAAHLGVDGYTGRWQLEKPSGEDRGRRAVIASTVSSRKLSMAMAT